MDLDQYRARLFDRRTALLDLEATGEAAGATVTLDQSRVGRLSRMDAMQGQAMARATNARRRQELARIEAALARIDDGSYGDCLACDEPIAAARLALDPAAVTCIACAEAAEQSR